MSLLVMLILQLLVVKIEVEHVSGTLDSQSYNFEKNKRLNSAN